MKKIAYLAMGCFLCLTASSLWADSTVESFTKFGGFQGMGAYEGTSVTRLQGIKESQSLTTKFTGAILSRVAGGGEQVTITRIDKGVVWNLDPKKKVYTESPIEPVKLGGKGEGQGAEKEKPTVRITKTEFKVKKTGASETINGFACEEYLVTWLMEMEDLETKEKTQTLMTTNLWTTPETAAIKKLQAEQAAFSNAYLKKIGMNVSGAEMKQLGMEALMSMSKASQKDIEKEFARFKTEMAKIKGYSIRTVVSWKVEGQGGNAPKAETAAPAEDEGITGGITGGIGGVFGGLKGAVTKKLIGEPKPPAGDAPFFSSMTEIKSINTDAIAGDAFDIPAGYTKK